MTQPPMHLIQIGDRVANLDRLNHARHFIQQDYSYVELYFDSGVIRLKDNDAERIWSHLETLCIPILVESIAP